MFHKSKLYYDLMNRQEIETGELYKLRALKRQMLCSQSEVDACGDSLMTALWELVDMEDAQGAVSAELGVFRCSTASVECRDSCLNKGVTTDTLLGGLTLL